MCTSRTQLCFLGALPRSITPALHSSFLPFSLSPRMVRRRPAAKRACCRAQAVEQGPGLSRGEGNDRFPIVDGAAPFAGETFSAGEAEACTADDTLGDLWSRTQASGPPPAADRPEFGLGEKQDTVATLSRDAADKSFDTVLQELTAIQKDGPRNVAILGTRYASYLHQQIIELLTYANVLVGNHVFTSGAGGTNAAVIRGALRAEKPDLLTVVLPQSLRRQPPDTQEQLKKVGNLVEMGRNDELPLDVASQLCNSDILSRCTHFIAFAFHDSDVVLEAVRQAKQLRMITTVMFLD